MHAELNTEEEYFLAPLCRMPNARLFFFSPAATPETPGTYFKAKCAYELQRPSGVLIFIRFWIILFC